MAKLTRAPANDAPIGGLKVVAANGWFAARPSGTEALYKIYAESFVDESHLDRIIASRARRAESPPRGKRQETRSRPRGHFLPTELFLQSALTATSPSLDMALSAHCPV